MAPLFAKVWAAYAKGGLAARTVTVKVKYADFHQVTRARSSQTTIAHPAEMEQPALDLLRPLFPPARGIRLLGVTLSHFDDPDAPARRQLALTL
jgi:DNA polymerase-4